jgi:hypothetical protein
LLSDEIARCPDLTALLPDAVLSPINDGLFALQSTLTVDFATTGSSTFNRGGHLGRPKTPFLGQIRCPIFGLGLIAQ